MVFDAYNSARQAAEISKTMEKRRQEDLAYKARLEAGAAANISQQKLLKEQVELLKQQNVTLLGNYDKLKELYDAQVQAAKEARDDLHRSRVFNGWMMAIAVVSMLAAIAGPIITIWVSR